MSTHSIERDDVALEYDPLNPVVQQEPYPYYKACRFALRIDPGFSSRIDPGGSYVPLYWT